MSPRNSGLLVAAALIALSGCGKPPSRDPRTMTGIELRDEIARCARGGVEAAESPECKKVEDESFSRFLGKSGAK